MSSNTRPPDPAHAAQTIPAPGHRHATLLRIAMVLAYPVLAHLASGRHDGRFAVLALADIALLLLLRPLLERRYWPWAEWPLPRRQSRTPRPPRGLKRRRKPR
jgi:hypothetical protein